MNKGLAEGPNGLPFGPFLMFSLLREAEDRDAAPPSNNIHGFVTRLSYAGAIFAPEKTERERKNMSGRIKRSKGMFLFFLLGLGAQSLAAGTVRGGITDKQTHEPLTGATVTVSGGNGGAVADLEGNYVLQLPAGTYVLTVKFMSYKDLVVDSVRVGDEEQVLNLEMESDVQALNEVAVTAVARRDNEAALLQEQRRSLVVQTGVSAQQMARTQDKDASEVIRRVPGVSIIDEKFVMVRGLSQRYNNVWLNGSAVSSSEADSRAFSFDVLPSSQLDNLIIVKSPAPEYPADFTGGFILIQTKQLPAGNSGSVSVGTGVNDRTHFRAFLHGKGSATDGLGFDNGLRRLDAGLTGDLTPYAGYDGDRPRLDLLNNGLNNDWRICTRHPWGDLKLSMDYNRKWEPSGGRAYGILAAVNYSRTSKTMLDMENSIYGPYDTANDKAVFLRRATDNQYSSDVRWGAMLNFTLQPRDKRHRYEWKNLFNQIAKDRFSERTGFNAQPDNIHTMEYYYSSRSTANTQFTGRHDWNEGGRLDWSTGYAYANRNLPDRRLIERTDRTEQTMGIYRISREFTRLDEHIFSANANYKRDFRWGAFEPTLKTGVYGEYRTRTYRTREFQYGWQPNNTLPDGFLFDNDVPGHVLVDANYGPDKLYLYEEVNYLNNYEGQQTQLAGYLGVNLPWKSFNLYAGLRYEYCRQVLGMNTRQYEESLKNTDYDYRDLFPSVNMTYKLNEEHQLRLAYGKSVNRPEFRELSTSVYYDFDLGSSVMGNSDLKAAYVHNVDFRYEWYPSAGEQVSVAFFYKRFKNPIEWTYTVAGGTDMVYSYVNAHGADNYGIELDLRKNLAFIGLRDFSLAFNGVWIRSRVRFEAGSNNIDRPMQGQSPYLINTGLFYQHPERGWTAAVLYNRIGKRIIGVGNRYGTASDGSARNIPNSYEMPRNTIDLSLGKRLGRWEVKAAVRDLLAERCVFKQFEDVVGGRERTVEEVNRSYRPGRTVNVSASYNF